MPDFSRWGGNGGDPSLNAIGRTDRYLDALASEQPVYATDPADAELANLLAGWRDEVRRPPARVATTRDAEIALQRALASRQRTRMSMAVVGSVAAALLCLGGFGAIVYGAGPGDALYGLRVALFGEQQTTRDDKVALAAQTEMQEVQHLIEQGNWEAAQDKLQTVTSTVQTVEDPQRQQELQQQLQDLAAKVQTRDPNATAPDVPPVDQPAVQVPQLPPGLSVPPGISLPPSLPLPPDFSVPQLPGSIPGSVVPPTISLPSLPALPGPSVPPDISLPSLPPISLPKSIPVEPKQPAPKPGQEGQGPAPEAKPAPKPVDPPAPEAKPVPKPVDPPKPVELPQPEPPKVVEQPKPPLPEIAIPKPAPEAPVVQQAPPAPVAPAPKAPPALAPAQEQAPSEPTTTILPVPAEKPKKGNQGD